MTQAQNPTSSQLREQIESGQTIYVLDNEFETFTVYQAIVDFEGWNYRGGVNLYVHSESVTCAFVGHPELFNNSKLVFSKGALDEPEDVMIVYFDDTEIHLSLEGAIKAIKQRAFDLLRSNADQRHTVEILNDILQRAEKMSFSTTSA